MAKKVISERERQRFAREVASRICVRLRTQGGEERLDETALAQAVRRAYDEGRSGSGKQMSFDAMIVRALMIYERIASETVSDAERERVKRIVGLLNSASNGTLESDGTPEDEARVARIKQILAGAARRRRRARRHEKERNREARRSRRIEQLAPLPIAAIPQKLDEMRAEIESLKIRISELGDPRIDE